MTIQNLRDAASAPELQEPPVTEAKRRGTSKTMLCVRRFLRNRMAVVGVVIFILPVLAAVVGPHA
jgi:peptide/nickel transport system permease protein